jgi:hypothetical protein
MGDPETQTEGAIIKEQYNQLETQVKTIAYQIWTASPEETKLHRELML